jgi:hypothetical protein
MKSLGIHIDAVKTPATKRTLKHQHPSWKEAAISFLARVIKKVKIWKITSAKLILIIQEAPKHADSPPDASGQSIIEAGK